MTPSPDDISAPSELQEQLKTLIDLIPTLIHLLEAMRAIGGGATTRLEELLHSLASVSKSLEMSSQALTALVQTETLSPALESRLSAIEGKQDRSSAQLAEMSGAIVLLLDWLSVPFPPDAGHGS